MRRRAFTLIELLVVITVIALLAVLMLPSFATTMSIYRDTQCRNNLKRLGEGFILASDVRSAKDGIPPIKEPGYAGLYPPGMLWPAVPANVVKDAVLFQCPEDEVVEASSGEEGAEEPGALVNVEYESPYGRYPLDTIGNGNCYKSRRGRDSKGPYTEYIMQDDEGTGGQYAQMDFNGWIDTDGGARVYDSGDMLIFNDLIAQTNGCVPAWTNNSGPGWPNGMNTCGNMNQIRYMGELFLENNNGRMQDARGKTYSLPNWVGSWGWSGMTNYGINTSAFKYDTAGGCIVLVDYKESRVDLDDRQTADGLLLKSARHFERVNYMMADGSVGSASPMEISPQTNIEAWKP